MKTSLWERMIVIYRKNEAFRGVLVVFLIIIAIFAYPFIRKIIGGPPTLSIVPQELTIGSSEISYLKAFYDPDGSVGFKEPFEVTKEAMWSYEDPEIAYVGTSAETQGMLIAHWPGATTLQAKFKDLSAHSVITVSSIPLEAQCFPFRGRVAVNEPVEYQARYLKSGVPDYVYEWQTPEGEIGDGIIQAFTFRTPGIKIVRTTITDRARTIINVECDPLEVVR